MWVKITPENSTENEHAGRPTANSRPKPKAGPAYKSTRKLKLKAISKNREKLKKFKGMATVKGRESEYNAIKAQVNFFIKYGRNGLLYLTGVPGSGKTHTILTLLNYLKVAYSYVNCSTLKLKNCIYNEICETMSCMESSPTSTLQALRYHLLTCTHQHILIIDEIDFLMTKNETFLYNLFELSFMNECKAFIIAISNTLGSLSSKLESRISNNRIEFKPYSADQLMDVIASERKNKNIKMNKSLELITKKVASSTGDIRKVKEVLEKSADSGDLKLQRTISILRDMTTPLLNRFVEALTFYQKLALYLNNQPVKSIFEWFSEFRSFCNIKNYPTLDFASFEEMVNELIRFDIYKMKRDGIHVLCNYQKEEMEIAMKNVVQFDEFKTGNLKRWSYMKL